MNPVRPIGDYEVIEEFQMRSVSSLLLEFYNEKRYQQNVEKLNRTLYDEIETLEKEKNTSSSETMHMLHLIGNLLGSSSSVDSSHQDIIQEQLETLIVAQNLREDCRILLTHRLDRLNAHIDFLGVLDRIDIVNQNGSLLKSTRVLRDVLVTMASLFDSISLSWEIGEYFPLVSMQPEKALLTYLLNFVGEYSGVVKILKVCSLLVSEPVRILLLNHVRGFFDFSFEDKYRELIIKTEFPLCVRVTHYIPCTTGQKWFGELKFVCKIELILDPVLFSITGICACALSDSLAFFNTSYDSEHLDKIGRLFLKMFSISLSQEAKKKLSRRYKKLSG
jgi:hypothetical protein